MPKPNMVHVHVVDIPRHLAIPFYYIDILLYVKEKEELLGGLSV